MLLGKAMILAWHHHGVVSSRALTSVLVDWKGGQCDPGPWLKLQEHVKWLSGTQGKLASGGTDNPTTECRSHRA